MLTEWVPRNQQTVPQIKEKKKEKEEDREPSLPGPSYSVFWVYRQDMGDQIQI